MNKPKRFFVEYNCKVVGVYKSLTCALNLIRRKGWCDDLDNSLWLVDSNGDSYNPINGNKLKGIL